MKLVSNSQIVVVVLGTTTIFSVNALVRFFDLQQNRPSRRKTIAGPLFVSIGLGPDSSSKQQQQQQQQQQEPELVAGVDYEIPDHESFRKSRRSKFDEQCDDWFQALLGSGDDNNDNDHDHQQQQHPNTIGCMGDLAIEARRRLTTPVELKNEIKLPIGDKEWTPYVSTKLPWTPLTPAFGLEEFGLPIPRRNAETWRHFDVTGMVEQDYSASPDGIGTDLVLSEEQVVSYQNALKQKGVWLDDDACMARLIYVNSRYVPQLSKATECCHNLHTVDHLSDSVRSYLGRLTDGFTDELAVPVPLDKDTVLTSFKKLSGPNHCLGDPTSQFAINTQQGTACFAALNTIKTGAVAYIHIPPDTNKLVDQENDTLPPVLIVNAISNNGGANTAAAAAAEAPTKGVACHPRTLVMVEQGSRLSLIQSSVDLDVDGENKEQQHRPKLYNGYTQVFLQANTNVTHSYLDETGGMVTPGVELSESDDDGGDNKAATTGENNGNVVTLSPREVESQRPQLKNTHLEAIDVHVCGENSGYAGTLMSLGGSGRIRIALSVSLLRTGAAATINGFSLSGGAQRTDMKTNIHHIAQGTQSRQIQKNLIGGRAVGAFRGRVRVEQSAQQTDSQQLSRTILLSDRSRAWAVPSLEIVADDVKCTHGATVSDLSEEELFYLRSRGLDRNMARNLLMYAFAGDITRCVDPVMLAGRVDGKEGLQSRVIRRLENVVPQGNRAVKGEYQSI